MNNTVQSRSVIARIVRLRILIPLVVLAYVLGGFVVPNVDARTAHLVLAVIAVLAAFTAGLFFHKYDSAQDKQQGYYGTVFPVTVVVMGGMVIAFVAHVIGVITASEWEWIGGFEGGTLALATVVLAVKLND